MLYIFTGSDTAQAKAEARKLAKKAELVVCGEGGESFEKAMGYVGSSGLFSPEVALLLDRPLETAEGKQLLENSAKELHSASLNVFVIAPKLSAPEKRLFPKNVEFKEFEPKGRQEPARINVFGFADTFLEGNKKKTWLGYRKLISEGIPPEEIHGILLWAIRSVLIAAKTNSATESGLKPFVYSKSKRAAERLGVEKVEQYSRDLVRAYHEARSGQGTMELNIETMILS